MDTPWEPAIVINGHALTHAQAMTVRVALGAFALELMGEGLGGDEHGRAMTTAYRKALVEVVRFMEAREP